MPFDAGQVLAKLHRTDRTPFIELLAGWLECAPDMDAVKAFARKSPEKYVLAISQIARLSGYADTTRHEHQHHINVNTMSDSMLEDKLRERLGALGLPMPGTIDAEFASVASQEPSAPSETFAQQLLRERNERNAQRQQASDTDPQ